MYELRDQELKIEEGKQAKKTLQLEKEVAAKAQEEYWDARCKQFSTKEGFIKEPRNKMRWINTQGQITNTVVTEKPIGTTCISEMEEFCFCMFCLEKRQQSSPAVMFARLRSNRRYKPSDEGREAREKTNVIYGALE